MIRPDHNGLGYIQQISVFTPAKCEERYRKWILVNRTGSGSLWIGPEDHNALKQTISGAPLRRPGVATR